MKTTSKIYVAMAAMLLAALAIPAAAQNHVPFNGAVQGHDEDSQGPCGTPVPNAPILCVVTTGTAMGSQGQFSLKQFGTVDLLAGRETGTAIWTADNGDVMYTTLTGSGGPDGNSSLIRITEIHTITGGTGRFAGAYGTFTMERWGNAATFTTAGSFHGTIVLPGAAQ